LFIEISFFMEHIEVEYKPIIEGSDEYELLLADLALLECSDFWCDADSIKAYFPTDLVDKAQLNDLALKYNISIYWQNMPEINWNEQWEKSFDPIVIQDKVLVRAPFHIIDKKFPYEIVIEPKMSFGSGHHETTKLMMEAMLNTDLNNKSIIDAGCGTSILAIFASKLGAKHVYAYDINEWAYNNSLETIERNEIKNIDLELGDVRLIDNKKSDVILANINRNILLNDIPFFKQSLNKQGLLLMSGFYSSDLSLIDEKSKQNKLIKLSEYCLNNWMSVVYRYED